MLSSPSYFAHLRRETYPLRYTVEEGLDLLSVPPQDSAVRRIDSCCFRNGRVLSLESFQEALRDSISRRSRPIGFLRERHVSEYTMTEANGIEDVLVEILEITVYWHNRTEESGDR